MGNTKSPLCPLHKLLWASCGGQWQMANGHRSLMGHCPTFVLQAMASKSNAKIASTSPLVTQTPPVAQAQRVVNPSPPQKNVYKVGSKAVLMPKRVGTITELTNSDTGSGAISATIKIDNDGSLTAILYFPGVPGATVTLAHQRLPETVEDPKPVPREALGLPPLPAGACDSDSDSADADENNAVKGKKRTVDQNKGKTAQRMNKAIASGSGTTYPAAQDAEARLDGFTATAFSFSAPAFKSKNTTKDSATTSHVSGSFNSKTSGSTSADLLTPKTMPPSTKRKSDATDGDQSKRARSENGGRYLSFPDIMKPGVDVFLLFSRTEETNKSGVVHNYNVAYLYHITGGTNTLQLPPAMPGGLPYHPPTAYYYGPGYGYRQTVVRVPSAQAATPVATPPWAASQQAPMPYQAPTLQAGAPLAPYSAAQQAQGPPAAPLNSGAPAPAGYYRQNSPQNSQVSPYAMDTRFHEQTSPIPSSSRGPGTYSESPQYPQ
ncbi:hypothetical protein PC9H_008399 [Pleurotus ostreatus]|uniref:Uncharacterized protein n=1 Tax=Pleurotus ostreatus TaxID=5322 RepID=A0A8H6ZR92_PLEOS|nr:uncharacterized protein PC9H_008399 [Pleurotus ostreatus]KAF7426034.1 hypothetical protein PC9H_008399 [Pleurotus ostreatus]